MKIGSSMTGHDPPHSLQRRMDEIRRRSSKIPPMRLPHGGDRIDGVGERGPKKGPSGHRMQDLAAAKWNTKIAKSPTARGIWRFHR